MCVDVIPMRILLADDQADVRAALRLLLEHEDGLIVAGDASSVAEMLARAEAVCPDVVLLDWELAGARSLTDAVRALCPGALVIALSSRPEAEADALRSGAVAFASKGDPPERLLAVLRSLAAPHNEI